MNEKKKYLREEYVSRINRVIDYIQRNIDKNLSLEELAGVANFSRFHFHRIFAGMVGETLNQFIQRIRVERAATQLLSNPKKSITEIALDCGFSGSAAFARAFKDFFGMSASQWRTGGYERNSKIRKMVRKKDQAHGKIGKDFEVSSFYIDDETYHQKWRIQMKGETQLKADVEVKELPDLPVAYIRHIGSYKGDEALFDRLFGKLFKWAGSRGLLRFPETKVMSVYYDNPEITDEDKLRLDVCISIPEDAAVDGDVGKMTLPGGKYAVARFELSSAEQYQDAWTAVCMGWLPESGYQPDDRPAFENYLNDPSKDPEGKHIVEICMPVKPL
jgi:AraC family transcriptional regulator